ncbi:hypothetical protein QYE76_058205 [Lolium multiflorum]|uniref:Uncharacterized protein n=1 Tax=Lolium multiflorum TaxID=4521 RepID=A0AAD8WPS6_LOLMU|nr:hypothetical protein QYE76_058205 [Lolium multiflorum]
MAESSSANATVSGLKTDETSSGDVDEVLMPSTTLDVTTSKGDIDQVATLAKPQAKTPQPIASSSAVPMVLGEGCDLSGLLSFDPESIEPAPPQHVMNQVPASSLPTNASKLCFLHPLRHWSKTPRRSRVQLARQRIDLHHAQLPLKADIADKCQRLNEKKAALDAKTDTSVSTAELEILRKELKDLEEKVRVTKELICDKEASIACSQKEAERLKAELKTDLAEIHALNKQLVAGKDDDDEAEIADGSLRGALWP